MKKSETLNGDTESVNTVTGDDERGTADRSGALTKTSPALEKDKEQVAQQAKPRAIGIERSPEREFVQRYPLELESLAETDVTPADTPPCDEGRYARDVDEPRVELTRGRAEVEKRDEAEEVAEDQGGPGYAALVDLSEDGGRSSFGREGGDTAGRHVKCTVESRDDGNDLQNRCSCERNVLPSLSMR